MHERKYLYVVLSSTPCKLGKFIRLMTHYTYNHVSVSLTASLDNLYSFARHYKQTPLCGGFVNESSLRYKNRRKYAKIKIFAIPVSDVQYDKLSMFISSIAKNSPDYVYNTISAVFSVIHKKIVIRHAFTCIEFAIEILSRFQQEVNIRNDKFYTIKQLDKILFPYLIYEGSIAPIALYATWKNDTFPQRKKLFEQIYLTCSSNHLLLDLFFETMKRQQKAEHNTPK